VKKQLKELKRLFRVCRRPGKVLSPACTVPTVKHGGGSIMVWGCMSAAGVGHLTVCDGTLKSAILQTHMLSSTHVLFHRGQNLMFQQYPCHTSRVRRTWLQQHSFQVLEWPSQSPDMSTILRNGCSAALCSSSPLLCL
uniref:Tc1-like transposase DDE domain-containing protein n=1 Tax=Amphiprion percula TaxID=161767 RepID=A0A3P8SIG2_AMPPE